MADSSVLWEEVCHMATGSPGALHVSSTHNIEVGMPPISQGNEHNCSKMLHSYHFSTNARERWDFFSPPGKKENQKIQCYFPGKYLEMSHLFSSRKEFPTTNTTTSKAIVHCFLIPEVGQFIKSSFGQMIHHFKPTPSNWFPLSPIISLHWQSHCSLLPIDLGRYVHGGV